ncbi:hypothetical protein GDO78_018144, partial [Eleutherodactylus coqui]
FFLDNKLLEKSVILKDLTEKIQTEPVMSPRSRPPARVPPDAPLLAGSEAPPTLQKQISAFRDYNGELAVQACELKKGVQERDEELQKQKSSISFLSTLVDDHQRQCECLENEMVRLVCSNDDLKEDYDQLLTRRRLLDRQLHDAAEKQRELLESLTKKKAMEAEQQNNFNERRKEEIWRRVVKKALHKSVSAEADLRHQRCLDLRDSTSLVLSRSHEKEKTCPRKPR